MQKEEKKEPKGSQEADQILALVDAILPSVAKHFRALDPSSDELRQAIMDNGQSLNSFMQEVRGSIIKIKNDKLEKAYDEAEKRGFTF